MRAYQDLKYVTFFINYASGNNLAMRASADIASISMDIIYKLCAFYSTESIINAESFHKFEKEYNDKLNDIKCGMAARKTKSNTP